MKFSSISCRFTGVWRLEFFPLHTLFRRFGHLRLTGALRMPLGVWHLGLGVSLEFGVWSLEFSPLAFGVL